MESPEQRLQHLLKLSLIIPAAVLALSAPADLRAHADDDRRGEHADHERRRDRDGDDREEHKDLRRLATGQYITPRFLDGALVYVYTRSGGRFTAATPIALGHFAPGATGIARNKGVGLSVEPNASGIGISADGNKLVVANNYNDSISVIDTATRSIRYEHDLRPFFANNEGTEGAAGGTFPFAVVVKGNGTAYVSSDRDSGETTASSSQPGRTSSPGTTPHTGTRSPPASTSPRPTTCRLPGSTEYCGPA